MNDYRFTLSYNSGSYHEKQANAKFGDDLSLDYTKQSGEEYFKKELNGKITFVNEDYDFIMGTTIDQRIDVKVEYYEHDLWWTYINCYFYRTDCVINEDDKIITVKLTTADNLDEFLGVLDKEVDLVKLAPRISQVMLDKRPCLQIYAKGESTLSCILSNMSWEQGCDAVTDSNELLQTYHFALWGSYVSAGITGTNLPSSAPQYYYKKLATNESINSFTITQGQYTLAVSTYTAPGGAQRVLVAINSSGSQQWSATMLLAEWGLPITLTLTGHNGNPNCKIEISCVEVYGRLISDVESVLGVTTFDLVDDMAGDNRNYKKVSPVSESGDLALSVNGTFSNTPTEWGLYASGKYYTTPYVIGGGEFHPVLRDSWGRSSYWVMQSSALDYVEKNGRKAIILKDAYRLDHVINAILAELMPGVTMESTFLRPYDPLTTQDADIGLLYISPKSNVLNINYTEPAQSAIITLRQILNMLKVCYKCYWRLSEYGGGYLYIEHIEWFRRGGRYTGSISPQIDLTNKVAPRNGKVWSYLTNTYSYDKILMPKRYEFGWADDVSLPFMGLPIEMNSKFVDLSMVEKFTANNFDADIDYLMLNPSGVSKDGFVIMKADYFNIIDNPTQEGGQNALSVILSYSTRVGETVTVEYETTGEGQVRAYDGGGHLIEEIDHWNSEGDWTTEWDLPAGTEFIAVHFGSVPSTFMLTVFEPSVPKLLYTNWNYNGYTDHWLQNGRLSFVYLSRYYAYDMPCRSYQIGTGQYAESKTAIGVAKNKIQEISFPSAEEISMDRLITTGLGNGKIRKISINLSSKTAKATLEYDTE